MEEQHVSLPRGDLARNDRRRAYQLERTPDDALEGVVAAHLSGWKRTARTVLEFGEEGLADGVASELAAALILLARARGSGAAASRAAIGIDSVSPSPRDPALGHVQDRAEEVLEAAHDHSAEDAVIALVAAPTAQAAQAAEVAVARLQRRHDELLRRLQHRER